MKSELFVRPVMQKIGVQIRLSLFMVCVCCFFSIANAEELSFSSCLDRQTFVFQTESTGNTEDKEQTPEVEQEEEEPDC